MEIWYLTERESKAPLIQQVCGAFSKLYAKEEIARICESLIDFEICDYEFVECEDGRYRAIRPTDIGKSAFGYSFDLWKKYRELVLADMDARKIFLAELERSKSRMVFFTEKGLIGTLAKVFTEKETRALIEESIEEDILVAVDHELIYLSTYVKITPDQCDIWIRCRDALLQEGF